MKYRSEYWHFKTDKGVEKKLVCVLAGENERKRMLIKAERLARQYGWKLL
jgi:hypothetical protein